MHCGQQSFPAVVQQSDWDIPLPAGTGDAEYLQVGSQQKFWAQELLCTLQAGAMMPKQ